MSALSLNMAFQYPAKLLMRAAAVLFVIIPILLPNQLSAACIYNFDFDLPIPSPQAPNSYLGKGKMQDAVIQITDHCIIEDLNVSLTLDHSSLIDLNITIENQMNTLASLSLWGNTSLLHVGGYTNLQFDDEAQTSIFQATSPLQASYRPATPLAVFDGTDLFGQWTIRIIDNIEGDSGMLHSVEFIITAPEPGTFCLFVLGTAAILRRHK
ncbi:MAG: hypothetical protein ABIG61_14455 [Planctomycetota bacterium]